MHRDVQINLRTLAPTSLRLDREQEGTALKEPQLPFPDVPLIVEDLLMQARQLAGTGATIEVVEEILDHVAALREGSD